MNETLRWMFLLHVLLPLGCGDESPTEENQPCVMRDAGGPDAVVYIDPPYGCYDHPDDLVGR